MSSFHSLKERLETVLKVKSGVPIVQLCKDLHTGRDQILEWVRRYDEQGESGLVRHKTYRQISCAEKEHLVRLYLEKDLSLREIYTSADISRTNLETWVRIVRNRGYSALYEVKRRGRKPKDMKQQKQERFWTQVIQALRPEFGLNILLEINGMARSVFYYHLKKLKEGVDKYKHEREEIKSIFHEHKGRYGYRRITAEMRNRGYVINHKTVQRIMKSENLKCQIRKVKYRSYKGEVGRIAPNILERDFKASSPNQKWVTDVTQINIKQTKLYLSPLLDLFNGEVISYNISTTPNLEQIHDMLDKAFAKVSHLKGLIIHTDQGWQYQHYGYCRKLQSHDIIQSMSRKGNCLDNAVAENFFGIMKSELLYAENFDSPEEFIKALEEYIDYYNNKRIKIKLNGMSPVQYRMTQLNT